MEGGKIDRLPSLLYPEPGWPCFVYTPTQEGHSLDICWEVTQIPHLHSGKLRSCEIRMLATYLTQGWSMGHKGRAERVCPLRILVSWHLLQAADVGDWVLPLCLPLC